MYQFIRRQTKTLQQYCVCFIGSVRGSVLRRLEHGNETLVSKQGEVRNQASKVTVSRGFFVDRIMNRVPLFQCLSERPLSRYVPADAGFACDKSAVLGDMIKGT